ncbi:ABC transporter substrate-binding protein [Jiangella endophytica]|uniref:ABC transporter substrate-binding protein n=1 Tax=Jiangella endophytica TaxID=1623398 RepID=UPI000E341F2F|nr:ABC transporter substrate-binding protein [Jiangella endophytica]
MRQSPVPRRRRAAIAAAVLAAAVLGACGSSSEPAAESENTARSEATDEFPVTVTHKFGDTTVPAEPQRVVVVGLTEHDIVLELGVTPIATTEWYGEQPYATWPWAAELLGDAEPTVLSTADGFEYEKIASLEPDLIVGTNAGLLQEEYDRLSEIAPTIASVEGSTQWFSSWQDQTRQVAAALGRSGAGEELITSVEEAYAEARAAHPEFEGLTVTFSQGGSSEGNLYVYPDGLNTDFLTDLGFTMTPGLEAFVPDGGEDEGSQALVSAENVGMLNTDVIVFATETADAIEPLLEFGTLADLDAVKGNRAVYTDGILAGAIYFMTPLSQKYVIDELVPRLEDAVAGEAPQSVEG